LRPSKTIIHAGRALHALGKANASCPEGSDVEKLLNNASIEVYLALQALVCEQIGELTPFPESPEPV
jgi:hypothetical protein